MIAVAYLSSTRVGLAGFLGLRGSSDFDQSECSVSRNPRPPGALPAAANQRAQLRFAPAN